MGFHPRSVTWMLVAVVLAACQPAGSTETPSAAAVSSSAAASPSATPPPLSLPRPTDLPTDGTCFDQHICLGLLTPAVTYHSEAFEPAMSFTVPSSDWQNLVDAAYVFQLHWISNPGDAIMFFREPRALEPDGFTFATADATVAGLTDWLSSHPLLEVTPASPVTIGGLSGVSMEIRIATGAVNHPSDCPVQTCVPFFRGHDSTAKPPWDWDWGSNDGETQRLYLLNASDGVIAVFLDSYDGTTFDALTTAADQILAGLTFG